MNIFVKPSRRTLLQGGSLTIAFSLMAPALAQKAAKQAGAPLPGDLKLHPKLSSWLRLEEGGKVRLLAGKVEIGQGILTAFAQLAADELDIDIKRLVIVSGDTRVVPDEGVTAGSQSVQFGGVAIQHAAAELRAHLLSRAAEKLGVDAASLKVADGTITAPGGKTVTYWDLVAGQQVDIEATGEVKLKAAEQRRYIGKPVQRVDIPAKATGALIYIQDLRPDGMLHGRVVRPPAYGAKLVSLDEAVASSMPGIVKVLRDGSFIGVIAQREEQAIAAADALRGAAKWEFLKGTPTSDTVYDWLKTQPAKDIVIKDVANPAAAQAKDVVEAEFRRPYHMHGTIGPSTAIATLNADGSMLVQTHTQSPFETAAAIAGMLGLP
jgi:CO/xanthine dehydrogenase Mo-binding subunit